VCARKKSSKNKGARANYDGACTHVYTVSDIVPLHRRNPFGLFSSLTRAEFAEQTRA